MSHPCLEGESASKLDDPGIVGRRDLAKRSAGNIGIRLQELSVVKNIEKLGTDLQGCVLGNFRCLRHSHVEVCASRATQNVPSRPVTACNYRAVRRSEVASKELVAGSAGCWRMRVLVGNGPGQRRKDKA